MSNFWRPIVESVEDEKKIWAWKDVIDTNTKIYFQKTLQKRATYIRITLKTESTRHKFPLLQFLIGKEERQLPRYESKQALASEFNNFFIAKNKNIVALIDSITSRWNQCIRRNRMKHFRQLSLIDLRKYFWNPLAVHLSSTKSWRVFEIYFLIFFYQCCWTLKSLL